VLGFRGHERDHSSACEEDSPRERTLREDWLVVDGNWKHAGVEEISCELMRERHFLGSGIPVKQLRSQRKGMEVERKSGMGWGRPGEQGQCWECTPIRVTAPNVRKNAAHKESSQEKSHIHRAKFNGRPKLPGWPGKRCAAAILGQVWLL
jgi:hypothetical protein